MRRPKVLCEICGLAKRTILHYHHIIPRVDPRCTNNNCNLAIVCPNCHSMVHTGHFIIIGVYHSTGGTQLMWFKKGETPPLEKKFWFVKENPLVITLHGDEDDFPD